MPVLPPSAPAQLRANEPILDPAELKLARLLLACHQGHLFGDWEAPGPNDEKHPPFLDEPTGGPIVAKESHFYMVDGEITVAMSKMRKGETWGMALGGRGQVDPFTRQEIQRELMIERFQEEHPGFDFRSAEFNGQVPDPRAFMGGVKYT